MPFLLQNHVVAGRNLSYAELKGLGYEAELPTLYNRQPLKVCEVAAR